MATASACASEDPPRGDPTSDAAGTDAPATDADGPMDGTADATDASSDGGLDAPSDVASEKPGQSCLDHPAPGWALMDVRSFEGTFGTPWPYGSNNDVMLISHVQNPTTSIQVLAIEIVAPPAGDVVGAGKLSQNPDSGQLFMFISRCPGDVNWSQGRVGCSVNGFNLAWKIPGGSPQLDRCLLEPGETYYLNVAYVQGSTARSGPVQDICGFDLTPPYSATCTARLVHGL